MERELWAAGHEVVVGVDEVGRGSWAGPLSVGAAVLPQDRRVYKVRDSKMLTEPEREAMFDRIAEWCVAWAVGHASQEECDELGMSAAQKLAARRAIDGLGVEPDRVLIDGNWDFVGGGRAPAASSRATPPACRSRRRRSWPRSPATGSCGPRPRTSRATTSSSTRAIPCPRHKMALQGMGPTPIHRRSWVFMDHIPWTGHAPRSDRPPDPDRRARQLFD